MDTCTCNKHVQQTCATNTGSPCSLHGFKNMSRRSANYLEEWMRSNWAGQQ
uniref:Uncharacterized protein n=1 Tax=Anguilla anguilla TaxID=7936 RepID=A0A0E9W1I0_ANGAN